MADKDFIIRLLSDPLLFTQYYYKLEYLREYYVAEHHYKIAEALKKVLTLETNRLIINVAPRFGKTELVVKMLMAIGLAFNSKSKFIHTSYSEKLALDNSEAVRDIVKSQTFHKIFGLKTKKDSDSKSKWYTEDGGGVYATSTGGQITGFGAGSIDSDIFSGAIILDDPMKPEDALSPVKRAFINERFDNTLRSRLNSEKTPIIIVMQRLHEDDLTGYLLKKEPGVWEHLVLPALKEDNTSLWEMKYSTDSLLHLMNINPYVFHSQYQQDPRPIQVGGEFWNSFNTEKHVHALEISDSVLHISIDNNVLPYIALSIWQIDDKYIKQIHEIPCREPYNSTIGAAKQFVKYAKSIGYDDVVYVYGDASTQNRSTIDEDKKSFIEKYLAQVRKLFVIRKKMPSKNQSPAMCGEFINSIYSSNYDGLSISINKTCKDSITNYIKIKKDENGNMLKKKVSDPKTKASYEEFGHFSDTKKDFIVECFKESFNKFKRRDMPKEPFTIGGKITNRTF